jgi:hypothetical protein
MTTLITTNDLTTGVVNGTGVFDELMTTITAHLDVQYKKQRIKGTEYSKVYLGSMEAAMQQAVLFLLQKHKAGFEADLIEAQIRKIDAEIILLDKESEKMDQEIILMQKQVEKITAEIEILGYEIIKIQAAIKNLQVDNLVKAGQVVNEVSIDADGDLIIPAGDALPVTGVIGAQRQKLLEEVDLTIKQQATEQSRNTLIGSQDVKTQAEYQLVARKIMSEEAQVGDVVGASAELGTPGFTVEGILGRQSKLLDAQVDGFKRDAEQKAVKLVTDLWSVNITADNASIVPPDTINKVSIEATLAALKAQAGLP